MVERTYGQFCGFSRALEMLGERWALLVIRDLLVGPKRFTDLLRGLPGIPTNVLTARLKELEHSGVVRRRVRSQPDRSIVYELTAYGLELEETVVCLSRWGAKSLDSPRPGETVTVDSMIMAMRTTFRPEAARGINVSYELHFGEIVLNVRIANGKLKVEPGPLTGADAVIEAGPGIHALMAGELSAADAIKNGTARIKGSRKELARFAELFRIDPKPAITAT